MATEPTAEQCSANDPVSADGRDGFAIWYPQMGGYVGKAVVLPEGEGHEEDFPFGGSNSWPGSPPNPMLLHHCSAEQFIDFGQTVQRLLGES